MSRIIVMHGYKYRMYPNTVQRIVLAQTFGCVRYVYNWALDRKKRVHKDTGESLSVYDLNKELTALKRDPDHLWLNDVLRRPLEQALHNLNAAYDQFFKKQSGYPQFKKKRNKQVATYTRDRFTITDRGIRFNKMPGQIKARFHRPLPKGGEIRSATVSKDPSGRYFVSILVRETIACLEPITNKVGIDLGLTHFAITSHGEKVAHPKLFNHHFKRLRRAQKALSRKQKGSKNREKARLKVARIYARIGDARKDFLHKLSTRLICENQAIGTEGLRVQNMMKNKALARAIGDSGWYELIRQLTYKAEWYGRDVVPLDTFFPSSKTCSACGYVVDDLPLQAREWTCPKCHTIHDRDINAAVNIQNHTVGMTEI